MKKQESELDFDLWLASLDVETRMTILDAKAAAEIVLPTARGAAETRALSAPPR